MAAAVPHPVTDRAVGGQKSGGEREGPDFWTDGGRRGEHGPPVSRLGSALAWMLPFGLLILSIVSVPLAILDEEGLPRYRALKGELAEVDRVNGRLRREVELLHREVDALRTDPETIERIARDELGMIRDDELMFQFSQ